MKKKYTIKFLNIYDGGDMRREITNIRDLNIILNGEAKGHRVYVNMGEDMPLKLHNAIADHNKKL